MALDTSRLDRNESVEYFWGGELTRDVPELVWDMKADINEDEDDEDFAIHTLFLKVVTLGKSAVSKEENIVQVEAVNYNSTMVKQPLVNMVAGVNNTVPLDMSFSGKFRTVFRLIEGSGPVYLSGHHLVEIPREDYSQDESLYTEEVAEISEERDDDDDDDDEDESLAKMKGKSKKRRNSSSSSPHTKVSKAKQKSKMEAKDSDSEDDEDSEDSEDEEEFDLSVMKKKKGKAGQPRKEKGSTATAKAIKKTKKPPAKK